MKTLKHLALLASFAGGLLVSATGQPATDVPPTNAPVADTKSTNTVAEQAAPATNDAPASVQPAVDPVVAITPPTTIDCVVTMPKICITQKADSMAAVAIGKIHCDQFAATA